MILSIVARQCGVLGTFHQSFQWDFSTFKKVSVQEMTTTAWEVGRIVEEASKKIVLKATKPLQAKRAS